MTAKPWRSACVAGLFALHPLHVESVAWIAERKDVLSTFFWMLTMWAYVRYTRRPGARRYALLLAAYIAALLSKPMVVTLPFVLLLLDVWPLRRLGAFKGWSRSCKRASARPWRRRSPFHSPCSWSEKLPLLLLAGSSAALAYVIQESAPARGIESLLSDRIANAVVSYVTYLGKMFWPTRLAVSYPFTPLPAVAGRCGGRSAPPGHHALGIVGHAAALSVSPGRVALVPGHPACRSLAWCRS